VISLGVRIGVERINIVQCRQASRIGLLKNKVAAERVCCFDDALDDLVPAGRVDDGVVNCRDQIAAAV
jgi:hypothetical protein